MFLLVMAADNTGKSGYDKAIFYKRGQIVSVGDSEGAFGTEPVLSEAFRIIEAPDITTEEAEKYLGSEIEDIVDGFGDPDQKVHRRRIWTLNLNALEALDARPLKASDKLTVSKENLFLHQTLEPKLKPASIFTRFVRWVMG